MTNARDRIEPLARLVGSMPGRDHAVELQELCFQGSQLGAESHETGACNLGQSFVTCIGDDIEQLFNPMASDRCNNAKLGKMGTDRVDHCGLLANKQVPRAMIGVNGVHLKTRLGDVETDCLNCLHVWLLSIVGALTAPTFMAEPSTASIADIRRRT